tara:strand:- start:1294 stop:1785 length:492 start_codon:yes stop_codon:yes gene_type:complete
MRKIDIQKYSNFFFDFDGVFTDNKVILNENGIESVICNRNDGIGIKILKKLDKKITIISTERNKTVLQRAKKLKIRCNTGVLDKKEKVLSLLKSKKNLAKTVYIGNDINDYKAMIICGLRICPKDSNNKIKKISNFILSKKGGDGIITCMLEEVFGLDLLKYI